MTKEAEFYNIEGKIVRILWYKSVIIGSGCAGLNCADSLADLGEERIALVTNGLFLSTSYNTGSDKQTYYKLSVSGDEQDSVRAMAETLFSCGGAEGYHCLTEAAMSLRCFYKLVSLGVGFPCNEYGEYVGYRTDHDVRRRATSCGPLTSKYMAEALIRSVKKKNVDLYEHQRAAKLLTRDGKVRGVLCVDTEDGSLCAFMAPNVVLATGGPSGIYAASVYPKCHSGALGLAMEAGCTAVNLTEWQYGIASVGMFRWNLSGSYMQAIPRFISVDEKGAAEEFLPAALGKNYRDLVFQKGYNWPFSAAGRSSVVDLAVFRERARGKRVFLDYTCPDGGFSGAAGELLEEETRTYLENCGALTQSLPVDRLRRINERAYRLFLDEAGIDLARTPLEIGVCAQHLNGGIDCDVNYMTSVDGLYAAGECAGIFGVARPGGTALNSTQVSSLRAAEHIAAQNRQNREEHVFDAADEEALRDFVRCCTRLTSGHAGINELFAQKRRVGEKMSACAAFVRTPEKLAEARAFVDERLLHFETENAVSDPTLLFEVLTLRDILISARCVLEAMLRYAAEGFKSRGGYLITDAEDPLLELLHGSVPKESDRYTLIKVRYDAGNAVSYLDKVHPIPESEQWFEKVYNRLPRREK